jgi:hypothetical protein
LDNLGITFVIPVLLEQVDLEGADLTPARERGARLLQIVDAAHEAGALNSNVTFGDIGLMPHPAASPDARKVSGKLNAELAHRHLNLLINGLQPADTASNAHDGPALTLQDLRELEPG